ncbi:hypothetical protein QQS21_004107 [Conoideocrella luteorostrata]|uniref:Peptidase S1 domain-containing protein n=1 Tax=Conoideocrella luteorostrata TaxID=1105319 RepID=A0AAJ0G041_9HYPO|nr:hypothetical protein QQS21_004107 [Conoideocrella luteorostrata]
MALQKALLIALAASTIQTIVALPGKREDSIVGGALAIKGEFPSIVSILLDGQLDCGGTLLEGRTVLTAAHCTPSDMSRSQVRIGSLAWATGGTLVNVSDSIVHPEYNSTSLDNDVALWKLSSSFIESTTIRFAKLASQGSDPVAKSIATVAGWGRIGESASISATLRKVSVPIVDRGTCHDVYQHQRVPATVTENMFCAGLKAGGKDSCQGDSGGPIIDAASGALIGTVSWGQGCGQPDYYGVYVRLGNYVDFIKQGLMSFS